MVDPDGDPSGKSQDLAGERSVIARRDKISLASEEKGKAIQCGKSRPVQVKTGDRACVTGPKHKETTVFHTVVDNELENVDKPEYWKVPRETSSGGKRADSVGPAEALHVGAAAVLENRKQAGQR